MPYLFSASCGCAVSELREGHVSICDLNLQMTSDVVQVGLASLGADEGLPQMLERRHLGGAWVGKVKGWGWELCGRLRHDLPLGSSNQNLFRALPSLPGQAWVLGPGLPRE